MLTSSGTLDRSATTTDVQHGSFLLVLLLAGLLAFATLAQLFFVIPNHRLFIRLVELLFTAVFLVEAGRTYEVPALKPVAAGWLFLGWFALSSVSVVLAGNQGAALIRQAEWMMHFVFAVALWHFLQRHALALKVILLAIPVGFILVGLHTLSVWISLINPRDYSWFESVPLVGHVRHFGYYALAGLIFSACPMLGFGSAFSWRERLVALVGMAFCWAFLFWTGGRAAVGSGLFGLAFMVWFSGQERRGWALVLSLVALGIGLWLSTFFWVNDPNLGFLASLERTATDTSAGGVNGMTTGRLTIWSTALAALDGHLWFGLGPDNYKFLAYKAHGGIQPHSLFVQFLVDWGILGAVPFLALLALAGWDGFIRLLKEQDPLRRTARVTAFALILAATIHSLVDGLYYYAQPLLFLFTCFAIVLLPVASLPEKQRPSFSKHLTARPTLWLATTVLALIFLLSSDMVALLFY